MARNDQHEDKGDGLREKMISVNRVTKVVKGGRILAFAALTVVGDGDGSSRHGQGQVARSAGCGAKGDGNGPSQARQDPLKNGTLHHEVMGKHGGTKVFMQPAPDGAGIKAGGAMRAVFEVMGITNISAKCHGSTNPYNVVRATLDGLSQISRPSEVAAKRGKTIEEIFA